jgi:hypothetical protein
VNDLSRDKTRLDRHHFRVNAPANLCRHAARAMASHDEGERKLRTAKIIVRQLHLNEMSMSAVMAQSEYLYMFVIVSTPHETMLNRLKNSAKLNGRSLSFTCSGTDQKTCLISLDGVVYGEGSGETRAKAKRVALRKTFDIMESMYPTIEVTSVYNSSRISAIDLNVRNAEKFLNLLNTELINFVCDNTVDVLTFQVPHTKNHHYDAIHQSAYRFQMKSNTSHMDGHTCISITKTTNILQIYLHLLSGGVSPKYRLKENKSIPVV